MPDARRFRTQAVDVNGITTGYAYDTGAARLYRTTAANGTQQDYRYCTGSDRTALTYINGVASIRYTYDRAQLSDLIRKGYLGSTGFWQHYLLNYDAFGNMTRVQVCASSAEQTGYTSPVTLASYSYDGSVNNGRLTTMTYGNGDSVSYTYDAFDRQRTAAYNDGTTYHYDYSGDNDLARQYVTDGSGAVTEQYSYQYDSLGRLIHSRQSTANGALIQSTQHMYDAANRMTSQSWQFGTGLYRQQYSYTGVKADGTADSSVDGTISAITTTIPGQLDVTSKYEYNDLRQLEKKTVTVPNQNRGTTTVYTRGYTYAVIAEDDGCNRMGTRLASTGYTFGSSSRSFDYTYDAAGNIQTVTTGGTNVPAAAASKTYTYDAQGQLATETNGGASRAYAYDTVGNIRSVTTDGAVIKSFGYTNPSWPDLLTSVTAGGTTKDILYEGQTQTSDVPSSGNPVTYYNGKDYTFTWTKGRQLASATVDGKQISYTYDMSGVRSNKQVGDTTYTYTTLSGKVMRQTWGDNNALEFVYDDGNQPFAVIYKHGQTTELYYYVLNAQGDVSAILDSSGKLAASYDYDAWGNCTVYDSSAKVLTDPTSIANLNPLRYRGYYYDAETGFYYVSSRYYDPEVGRWINADDAIAGVGGDIRGYNLFAYCMNDPVNMSDHTGHWPQWIKNAASAVVNAVKKAVTVVANTVKSAVSSASNILKASSNSLPKKGEPGSSQTLPNPDGTPKQKRWYGPDGNPERDRDYNHPGNMPFPHDHEWKNGERGKEHLPPDPSYKMSWEPVIGAGLVVICTVGIIAVAADDLTGVGVADDFLFGPLGAGVGEGLIMIFG
ncbi:RHS repeat-associated core domain-containing protein [Gemmiger formicilis]|uniref:RHS repeat-associated core domain-containing protein n=1 Tax=Gemmiger formicilis TaxID=745368 RepID=UPI002433173B|nr:RHS repeat-associated core domain-containing protein [Gemmiger formicilis]